MLILKNANIIDFVISEVIYDNDIVIEKGKIIDVGHGLAKSYINSLVPTDKVIDLKDKYISPGLVCSHNHFYSSLARGITANVKPSRDFIEILKNLWWKLDKALDEETLYYSGVIGAIEAIKSGTTSVIDHNASPSYIKGALSTLKYSFENSGLRGILCYEITCRNGMKEAEEGIKESEEFIESLCRYSNGSVPLVEAAVGAHASFTLNNKALERIAELVHLFGRGIHIHVGEDRYDTSFTHHSTGMDILEYLDEYGVINNKSIFAHGVYISEKDIELINKYDSFLVHNPRSNMNNNVGYLSLLKKVNNVALGTDGISSDMLEEIKFGYFKNRDSGGSLWGDDFSHILQKGNTILERYFNLPFGRISKGYVADLTIYDYRPPTPLNNKNLSGHLIFGFSSKDVESVIVNGKVVYENRAFPYDVSLIYNKASKLAEKLWEKMDKITD